MEMRAVERGTVDLEGLNWACLVGCEQGGVRGASGDVVGMSGRGSKDASRLWAERAKERVLGSSLGEREGQRPDFAPRQVRDDLHAEMKA